jgi:serine-type D-Ala-D-Ala carboxypeptidase (penicillin-binding protein 5/6)
MSCRAVILSDAKTGQRLFAKDPEALVLPASTTKVMTAILVMEKLNLDDYVTVGANAANVQPSKIGVKPGEEYTVRDLMNAILLNSANDAAIVLAEAVAGSEAQFVEMMNARAVQLGARHTRFANSHGLPTPRGTQYTTAYDMHLLFKQALEFPFFHEVIMKKYETITSKDGRDRKSVV